MFGNVGQIASLLKNAGQIRQNAEVLNERLKLARHVGEAGGGQVKATVDGRGDIQLINIDRALVAGGDVELIEDLTAAAVRDAVARSRRAMQQEIAQLAGGLNLPPGLLEMLGGGS